MAKVSHSKFNDYEELANAIDDASLHANQISSGTLKSEFTKIEFNNLNLQLGDMEGADYVAYGEVSKDVAGFVFNFHDVMELKMNGKDLDNKSFLIYPAGSEHYSTGKSISQWGYISLKWDYLIKYSNNFQDDTLKNFETFSIYSHKDRTLFESYIQKINEIRAIAKLRPEILKDKKFSDNIEKDLIEHNLSLIICSTPELKRNKSTDNQMLVMKKFFDLVHLENIQKMDFNQICRELGISLRTFYYAFEKVYNLSPVKFLEIIRLHQARKDLLKSEYAPGVVTRVAADHGFWHFGRFAEQYRKLFGERPSDTVKNKIRLKR